MALIDFLHLILLSVVLGFVFSISQYPEMIKHGNEDDIKSSKTETLITLLQLWCIWTAKILLLVLAIIVAVIGVVTLVASII